MIKSSFLFRKDFSNNSIKYWICSTMKLPYLKGRAQQRVKFVAKDQLDSRFSSPHHHPIQIPAQTVGIEDRDTILIPTDTRFPSTLSAYTDNHRKRTEAHHGDPVAMKTQTPARQGCVFRIPHQSSVRIPHSALPSQSAARSPALLVEENARL